MSAHPKLTRAGDIVSTLSEWLITITVIAATIASATILGACGLFFVLSLIGGHQ